MLHTATVRGSVNLTDQGGIELERLVSSSRVAEHIPYEPDESSNQAKDQIKRIDWPGRL